jgi:hypothetical protein
MMKQQEVVEDPVVLFNDRPARNTIIQKDEIIDFVIDLETLSSDMIYKEYFSFGVVAKICL